MGEPGGFKYIDTGMEIVQDHTYGKIRFVSGELRIKTTTALPIDVQFEFTASFLLSEASGVKLDKFEVKRLGSTKVYFSWGKITGAKAYIALLVLSELYERLGYDKEGAWISPERKRALKIAPKLTESQYKELIQTLVGD